ncbi:unnamed protein product [Plutella xylostella]|uniref:(diamondback moth) hypothetical protein n=1 Tax=Plutella xylostella TaxID=51655 RepID=A0A8S4EEU6_PLUXY|nr:unnamed protein product [Plutella xylostella]
MDRTSMDHYEKQLYSVFKTFDVDNEEALDKSAVLELCDTLQLEDRGAALADSLFERPHERVTFTQFRNGLLSVLGGSPAPPEPPAPAAASDDDSSGREVAPKLVVGAKRYGRRSRPSSASPSPAPPARRARPASPPPALLPARRLAPAAAAALCADLHMDGLDPALVQRIFDDAGAPDLSVAEFFERLNSALSETLAAGDAGGAGAEPELSAEAVCGAWERGGVPAAPRLLRDLGFTAPALAPAELQSALDAALAAPAPPAPPGAAPDPRAPLLHAALALQRLRLAAVEAAGEAARAEAGTLRAALAAADRRAAELARDVDDDHARVEASLQARVRALEARRGDEARAHEQALAAERARGDAARARLQASEARAAVEGARARGEAAELRARAEEEARRAAAAERRVAALVAARDALAGELRARGEAPPPPPAGPDPALAAALEQLRLENKQLRDRTDELVAELEAAARGAGAAGGAGDAGGASWREEVGAPEHSLASLLSAPSCTDECDQSFLSLEHKVFGQLEGVRRLQRVLEGAAGAGAGAGAAGCNSCAALQGIISSVQERVLELTGGLDAPGAADAAAQTEGNDDELDKLQKQLAEEQQSHEEEKLKLSNLVKDLESSLDALKLEYDKCEDYWSGKLDEERELHAEEQRASDERLSDLVDKISEYEQQFAPAPAAPASPPGRLPTIDESHSLELQFNDLQDEFDKYKQDTEEQLKTKTEEIEKLNEKIKALEERPVVNGSKRPSPIDYLWSQGTIHSPQGRTEKAVRNYQNPAFMQPEVRSSSDSDRERPGLSPIRRPMAQRSASAGTLRDEPQVLHCSELEGQLRQQAQLVQRNPCACAALEARCRQLAAALRHRQLCLDAVQQAARSEGSQLRARVAAAEAAAARLHARLASADLLVKELYVENCQLSQHQTRLL